MDEEQVGRAEEQEDMVEEQGMVEEMNCTWLDT